MHHQKFTAQGWAPQNLKQINDKNENYMYFFWDQYAELSFWFSSYDTKNTLVMSN